MSQRLPLALFLSLAFVFFYTSLFAPPPDEVTPGDGAAVVDAADGGVSRESGAGVPAGEGSTPTPNDAAPATPTSGDPVVAPTDGEAREVSLADIPPGQVPTEQAGYSSRWSSLGAALVHYELTSYEVSPGSHEPLPLLGRIDGVTGNFLVRDTKNELGLERRHWIVEEGLDDGGQGTLSFRLDTASGLRFTRTVSRTAVPHTFAMTLSVENIGGARSEALSLVQQGCHGLVDEEAGSQWYGKPTSVAVIKPRSADAELVSWSGEDLLDGASRSISEAEVLQAAGAMTTYFASLLMPVPGTDVRAVSPVAVLDESKLMREIDAKLPPEARDEYRVEQLRAQLAADFRNNVGVDLMLRVPALEPGQAHSFDFQVYNGPKSQEAASLPELGVLTPVIEASYGSFAQWINRMLLKLLRMFHGLFGNWGVSIIVLTILVKGLLFPINRRQQTSMAKYSAAATKLKPQIDELKKKYKNNTRKFNEEQMKLMRAEGASPPLGGCLLMFLQIPIWVSLFQILGTSIELRQSHFVGWITDLSRPDALGTLPFTLPILGNTLNLLPLLMTVATIVQMRSQPKPADDNQAQMQKVMGLIMPIFMLVILYNYSSGLSLYIFTSSLIGIFEYQVIRRIWPIPGQPGRAGAAA